MSLFAKIDDDGIVLTIIVVEQDFIDSGKIGDPDNWVETSREKKFRKNYAVVGYTYDKTRDAFIPPRPPYPSWSLNETTCQWEPPTPIPEDSGGVGKLHDWDEDTTSWVER